MGKSEETSKYILKKVAPIFNKKGYHGTSMSDITSATGLTKGAIYGNFKDKEDLSLKSFQYIIRKILVAMGGAINDVDNHADKLQTIVSFYRNHLQRTKEYGGCPIMCKGLDSLHIHPALMDEVTRITEKILASLTKIISDGKQASEITKNVDSNTLASEIYCQIDGGLYLTMILNNRVHLDNALDRVEKRINDLRI